ncbi:MAG: (deoxy)nucleoside triphosphate pyrophosphohydrolase [Candidatus Saccharicenans sp.]|nr:(deoxy)nucleoside triphosphate pyrophosphohydrolase [Candidatus Saccharicenans sp.]
MIVVAAVIKKDGRLLLAERLDRPEDSGWEFPGGKVEPGETPEEALTREIKEEMGIEIRVLRFLDQVELPGAEVHQLQAYEAEILSGKFALTSHRRYLWVKPDELENYRLLPADGELVRRLTSRNLLG